MHTYITVSLERKNRTLELYYNSQNITKHESYIDSLKNEPYYAKSVVQRSRAGASAAYVHSVTKTYTSLLSP